ncbi:hypothetical protein [Bacillus ndiopicus]|uniref:hypothetical protein n=1 Tax=Bacillus ndiopicus TaxID=1347368 RepID=UPI0005AB83F2|nr:hypothetical protein [Bacillus ndiopicus]
MNKLGTLEFNSSLDELNQTELIEVEGGAVSALTVAGLVGGGIVLVNEVWKFSGGLVQGFKDGFSGR